MDGGELSLNSAIPFAGRYILKQLLGTGGMGSVYLASDSLLGDEPIAIKVLHVELCKNEKHTQRFLREVKLTRKVTHPNVVRTFDAGEENGRLFFTMEYARGVTLKERLQNQEPLEAYLTAVIIREVCKGLQAIHDAEIIHRDLKPGNIILTSDDSVKITDFGVAKPGVSDLTGHNEIIGSIPYMAPEVWVGKNVGPQADIYALGVVAYEMLTGVLPFDGDSPAELMCKHLDQKPVSPRDLNEQIPAWLDELVLRMLQKEQTLRPDGASAIVSLIDQHCGPDGKPLDAAEDDLTIAPLSPQPHQPAVLGGFSDTPLAFDEPTRGQSQALEVHETGHKRSDYVAMPERWLEPDGYDFAGLSRLQCQVRHATVITTSIMLCGAYLWWFEQELSVSLKGLWAAAQQMRVAKGVVWALVASFAAYAPVFSMPLFLLTALRRNLATSLRVWAGASVVTFFSIAGVFFYYWSKLEFGDARLQSPLALERIFSSAGAALITSAEVSLLVPQGTVYTEVITTKTVLLQPLIDPALRHFVPYWISICLYLALLSRFIERVVTLRKRKSWRFKLAIFGGCGVIPVVLQLQLLRTLGVLQEMYVSRDLSLLSGPIEHLFDHYSVACAALTWSMLGIGGVWVIPYLFRKFRRE